MLTLTLLYPNGNYKTAKITAGRVSNLSPPNLEMLNLPMSQDASRHNNYFSSSVKVD